VTWKIPWDKTSPWTVGAGAYLHPKRRVVAAMTVLRMLLLAHGRVLSFYHRVNLG
jgi:hypothetical protein